MVDRTSPLNLRTHDIHIVKDLTTRTQSFAKTWMSNIDALIKLRKKGTNVVSKLPRGVFRYVLDYQFPNELCYRYSDPTGQIKNRQERHFLAIEKLSYDNYLVAVNQDPYRVQYQFTLTDGANCGTKGWGNNWSSL